MAFIGGLDVTNLIHALFFNSWGYGNGTSDKYSGNMPSYLEAYQNCAFTNCGVGEGYLYNAKDGLFHPNSVNAYIASALNIAYTAVSKLTIVTCFNRNVGQYSNIAGAIDNIDNYYDVFIWDDTPKARVQFSLKKGGTNHYAVSTAATGAAAGVNCLAAIKDGSNLIKLVLNGVEVSYNHQDAYGHGNYSLTDNFACGIKPGILQPCRDDIYAQLIYDDALTTARCLDNYNLLRNYGLKGINTDDLMTMSPITIGSAKLIFPSRIKVM